MVSKLPPSRRSRARDAYRARAMARTPREAFFHGIRHSVPLLVLVAPFGLLFGVVAAAAGFDLAQIMGFSILVLAGASQFTAVQLLTDNAPVWLVILSSLAVNLRMAMYSASMVPWLGGASQPAKAAIAYSLIDQTFALSLEHFQNVPKLSLGQRLGYFFGAALVMCLSWIAMSLAGATLGNAIPASVPLDFAVPITFLALIAPALRSIPHVAAATVAVVASLLLIGLPSGVGPMVAGLLAMLTGAFVETMTVRAETAH